MPGYAFASEQRCFVTLLLSAIIATAAFPADAAIASDPLPTQDDIHQLFEQKQYHQALQKIAQVLMLKGDAAKPYDRHDLLRLKAEALLQLKAYEPAEHAFVAAGWETNDRTAAAVDFSTSVLVHRSKLGEYQSAVKVNGKTPERISVIGAEFRKVALQALFQDELSVDTPKIAAVRDARTLDPICQVAPLVTDLKVLELAVTEGHDDQTRELISDLAKRAQDMMWDTLQNLAERQGIIVKRANEDIEYYVPSGGYNKLMTRKRGYDLTDHKELDEISATCRKIAPAARALGDAMGPDGADLIKTSTAAARLAKQTGS